MSEMTCSVMLTDNGGIPVPEDMRRALGLKPRQTVHLRQVDDRLLVEKSPAGALNLRERAALIIKEARLQAAREASTMTAEEVWALYEAAAQAIGATLTSTTKRKSRR
ncbi:MAG: AbrB/MazE/SpoVT family DNA-binding domain-containing protein [Anaerolineales bacterium]|nr:AbrB/MazE/SpoVT family DNA-binding domain-containing protein [Anaerolineales bacterium]